MNHTDTLVIPELAPAQKHPAVFKKFDALQSGESFLLVNDHDPKPLYYEMIAQRGKIFSWQYLEEGPVEWRVKIEKNKIQNVETIGQMVAKNINKAEVFKKYGIDFCCGGKKTVHQVCKEKGIDEAILTKELEAAQQASKSTHHFDLWEPDFLAGYIYNQHHRYYYDEEPVITELMEKVAGKHGDQFPALKKLSVLYNNLRCELTTHFMREEKVLFPFIKKIVQAKITEDKDVLKTLPSLTEPVHMMEADHEAAGDILEEMKTTSNGYEAPANACNSFRFLYHKLAELEEDLHQHIHLENNILFPKALAIEKSLRS